jgi:citrate lyase subunit beta / citryl-CoA lyase
MDGADVVSGSAPVGLPPRRWRSLLFMPMSSERFLAKVHTYGADAIVLDLEDSVAPAEKPRARQRLGATVERLAAERADVMVRINRPWPLAAADLAAAVRADVQAIMLPKASTAGHVAAVDEFVGDLEHQAGLPSLSIALIPLVETAEALDDLPGLARASRRAAALTFGAEDLATSLGVRPDSPAVAAAGHAVVLAARSAGLTPLGLIGSVANYADTEAFRDLVRRSRASGYCGSGAIHPAQVPILNAEFSPSHTEISQAWRIVAAYDAAVAAGQGAVGVDGAMVDAPVAERARGVLRLASALSEHEG